MDYKLSNQSPVRRVATLQPPLNIELTVSRCCSCARLPCRLSGWVRCRSLLLGMLTHPDVAQRR